MPVPQQITLLAPILSGTVTGTKQLTAFSVWPAAALHPLPLFPHLPLRQLPLPRAHPCSTLAAGVCRGFRHPLQIQCCPFHRCQISLNPCTAKFRLQPTSHNIRLPLHACMAISAISIAARHTPNLMSAGSAVSTDSSSLQCWEHKQGSESSHNCSWENNWCHAATKTLVGRRAASRQAGHTTALKTVFAVRKCHRPI